MERVTYSEYYEVSSSFVELHVELTVALIAVNSVVIKARAQVRVTVR